MAGWLHGVFVGEWLFVFPLCGLSLSLFCNYPFAVPVRFSTVWLLPFTFLQLLLLLYLDDMNIYVHI